MPCAATDTGVLNAIAEPWRRQIIDTLMEYGLENRRTEPRIASEGWTQSRDRLAAYLAIKLKEQLS
jgi:hypothetical protein